MDRRTQADRDTSSGKVPAGQTSRGTPSLPSKNPKNNASRRPDHVGYVPNEGDGDRSSSSRRQFSDGFPDTTVPGRFRKGNPSSIPGPDNTNRGWAVVDGGNVPGGVTNTSANRQRFGIDPGEVVQPSGDSTDGPEIPRFGVGTNGE